MKGLALGLAAVFFIVAILYWTGVTPLGQHAKHGILFFILGALCLVWMRFTNSESATPSRLR